jgi:hypothetical protein
MSDTAQRNTSARGSKVHRLPLRTAEWRRLSRAVLPFGFCARVLPETGLHAGDRVLAFRNDTRDVSTALVLLVTKVYSPREYPGVKLGSVVAILEVKPHER